MFQSTNSERYTCLRLIILLWTVPAIISCKSVQPISSFDLSDFPRPLLCKTSFKPKYISDGRIEILEKEGGFLGSTLEIVWHRIEGRTVHFPIGRYSFFQMNGNAPIINRADQENITRGEEIWNRYMGKIIEDFHLDPSQFLFSIPGVIFVCIQNDDYRSPKMFQPNALLDQTFLKERENPYKPLPNNLSTIGNDEVLRLVYLDVPNRRLLMLDRMSLENNRTLVVVHILQSIQSRLNKYGTTPIRAYAYATIPEDLPVAYRLATQKFTGLSLQILSSINGTYDTEMMELYDGKQIKIR